MNISRAIIVDIHLDSARRHPNLQEEIKMLVSASGLQVAGVLDLRLVRPNPHSFLNQGKIEQIEAYAQQCRVDVIVFNHALSGKQVYVLQEYTGRRVIDRITLILDIFAQRARSYEGKLQVEFAQLRYLSSRLIRSWTHLERQKGGIGLRGPGEKQLETDRRLIGQRIKHLKKSLAKLRKQRHQSCQRRKKHAVPVVAFIGYTNAGKSTLFNRLTGSEVKVANKFFATLDPTLRRAYLPSGNVIVFADTVGFIRDLPYNLIEAFKATLDEISEANVLLHVIDADFYQRRQRIDEVEKTLRLIGAQNVPQIQVYNKIDCYQYQRHAKEHGDIENRKIWLSAKTGSGIDYLFNSIEELLLTTQQTQLVTGAGKQECLCHNF